ncbi:MAG: HlyC/CorC family transporter, partial [Chloroflexi bacterium]|nr:HlyC/CorC family transporter [Chloroflexota bacterium]
MESDSSLWWQFVILGICLILAVFASAAETALTSLGKIRIRHLAEEGNRAAQQLQTMLSNPGDFLSTILVINNVAVIVASTLTANLTLALWKFGSAEAITTAALSIFILIFCEITPKTIAIRNAERWALRLAGPVRALTWILGWLVRILASIPPLLVRAVGVPGAPKSPFVTEEEIRMLVGTAEEEGVIEEDEEQMIHSIFEFGDTTAREIMVPRVDIKAVQSSAPIKEVIDLMLRVGHSRIPVYDESVDNVIGIVFDRDLFKYVRENEDNVPLMETLRPAYFVPESKKADELLRELQKQRVQMAIVVDEYGGTAGLVTVEDILEEIVGEIQDEFDAEEDAIEPVSENEVVFNALVNLDDVNRVLDIELQSDDVDTLGGYVYSQLGKMPNSGDSFEVDNVSFSVVSTVGRRIKKVRVIKQPQE